MVIQTTYLLDDDEREALKAVEGGEEVRWCEISKRPNDPTHYYTFGPHPRRSLQPRHRAIRLLNGISSRQGFRKVADDYDNSDLAADLRALASTLNSNVNQMPSEAFENIRSVIAALESAISDESPTYAPCYRQDVEELLLKIATD